MLNFLHEFPDVVFFMVAMESLLGDEDVLLATLELRLKRAITFDPTVGLRSNVYMSFRRPFSLGLLWNSNSVTRRCGMPDIRNVLKWS